METKVVRLNGVALDFLKEYKDLLYVRYGDRDLIDKLSDSSLLSLALQDSIYYEKNLIDLVSEV